MLLTKIISGGQTGADMGGLLAARQLGIATGGWAPKEWMTEDGPAEDALRSFGLRECPAPGYSERTWLNVSESHGTVVFGDTKSPGSRLTIRDCNFLGKPFLVNPSPFALANFLTAMPIEVLNVAGNRASKDVAIEGITRLTFVQAVGLVKRAEDAIRILSKPPNYDAMGYHG